MEPARSIILQTANGIVGQVDIERGILYVGGKPVMQEPGLYGYHVVTGRFGDRIKKVAKKIIKAQPLRKLAAGLSKIANSPVIRAVTSKIPPPIGTAIRAAQGATSMVASLKRGNPEARARVQALARVALDPNNPQAEPARAALDLTQDIFAQEQQAVTAQAFQAAQSATRIAAQLARGSATAIRGVAELRANAQINPAAATALRSIQVAFRGMSPPATAGACVGAAALWGHQRPMKYRARKRAFMQTRATSGSLRGKLKKAFKVMALAPLGPMGAIHRRGHGIRR